MPSLRPTMPAALLVALALCSCTTKADVPDGSGSTPIPGSPASSSADSDSGPDASAEQFERELRARLELPALPSFSIPTGLLSTPENQRISDELAVSPGLYEGIAVLDARCTDSGEVAAADDGATPVARAQKFEDATTSITVGGDGTGVYDAPGIHVAVLADGSGNSDDGSTRVSIASDGSGTFDSGDRRMTVAADGTGSFEDEDVRIWFDETGAGGYEDDDIRVSMRADGTIFGDGDEARVDAITAVLEDGLPLFPPVPRIEQVEPTGSVCGTVIRLDANVLFGFDQSDVQPEGEEYLTRVAALLVALGSPRAQVNGHSDQVGDVEYNLGLSMQRADSVVDQLIRNGVDRDSLQAKGFGETVPLRPETLPDGSDDAAARQLNRRVEIVLPD